MLYRLQAQSRETVALNLAVGIIFGVASGIRLGQMFKGKNDSSRSSGKMPSYVGSERGAHRVSNRPVAYLKVLVWSEAMDS